MYASYFIASKNKKIARKCLHRCVTASQRTNKKLTRKCASCLIHCKDCVSLCFCSASCAIVCKKHYKSCEVSQCDVYGFYIEHRHVLSLYCALYGEDARESRHIEWWPWFVKIRAPSCIFCASRPLPKKDIGNVIRDIRQSTFPKQHRKHANCHRRESRLPCCTFIFGVRMVDIADSTAASSQGNAWSCIARFYAKSSASSIVMVMSFILHIGPYLRLQRRCAWCLHRHVHSILASLECQGLLGCHMDDEKYFTAPNTECHVCAGRNKNCPQGVGRGRK